MSDAGALPLRPYQLDMVRDVEARWAAGVQRVGGVLPTGGGKTVIFTHLARRAHESLGREAGQTLVIAHRTELISQAAAKLRAVAPNLRVGIVQGNANGTMAPVVVASVQTLANERRLRQLLRVRRVIVDEAHHAAATSYMKILRHFGCFEQGGAVAFGVTATMTRGDKRALGSVWQEVVVGPTIADMIGAGWLVRPRGLRIQVQGLDLARVKRTRGDYQADALGQALEDADAPRAIVKALREHAGDRPTIIFAPLVHTAGMIRDELRADGYTAELVHGGTPAEERRRVIEAFQQRRVQVLCNAMVFTEGTDLPLASCCVIARPTTHTGLYVQMVGRVLRPNPGKTDALVLDVVGASTKHGLIAPIELFGEGEEERQREPCGCWGDQKIACPCGRRLCTLECLCGGGRECGCSRVEEEVLDDGELVMETALGVDADAGAVESWGHGELVAEHVDLFHQSKTAWLRTYAGVFFIPAGERYLVVLPAYGGGYDVASIGKSSGSGWRWVRQGVESFSYACAWAEGDITPSEGLIASRGRSWRAARPTEKTLALAARMGIVVTPEMTGGEVSSRITVAIASRRIDAGLPAWMRGGS